MSGTPALSFASRRNGLARINERIRAGEAIVRTLEQLCREKPEAVPHPHVVALAFTTNIARTAVMLCVPVTGRGVFTRAAEITLNGVPGHPGPAPNERLGVVDALVFAQERVPSERSSYDGAALFLDLLRGNTVEVQCRSVEGTMHRNKIDLASLDFARLYVYNAAIPFGKPFPSGLSDALDAGTQVELNGSRGIVVGPGTRHRSTAPALSLAADLHDMDPELMSGSRGDRPLHTIALALAVHDVALLADLVAWAESDAHGALLCPSARDAAARLQAAIQRGSFLLTETGAAG